MGSILAIGGTKPVVVAQKNGHFGVEKQMTVTITCDHRHIYGADAALFLKDLGQLLEEETDSLVF
jgi:pyruvate dehydrogenase E2 component (dihydrolipoamide acetyltransferase)